MALLIKDINILNPNEEIINSNILIEGKRISEISESNINTPEKTFVIEGEDNFILPGFIDLHTHILGKGFHKEENMANPLSIHFYDGVPHGKQTIDAGVTTVRDCGGADLGVKIAQKRGLFTAPRLKISVTPLYTTGGHFDLLLPSGFDVEIMYPGFPKGRCDGVSEVLKKTREVKRAGADFIKLMGSGGVLTTNTSPNFPQFNLKELKTITSEAKNTESKVSVHCHSLKGIENCIEAGVDSIEHGTFINKRTSSMMANNGITLIPTLLVHEFLYKEGFPKWDNYAAEKKAKLKEVLKVHKENVSIAYDEGVTILFGTDSGVIPHGHNLKELSNLVSIGMSPNEAIAAATIKAADFINEKDNLGSISKNKIADMVIVNKNPLDDVGVLADNDNILKVIQDGKIKKEI